MTNPVKKLFFGALTAATLFTACSKGKGGGGNDPIAPATVSATAKSISFTTSSGTLNTSGAQFVRNDGTPGQVIMNPATGANATVTFSNTNIVNNTSVVEPYGTDYTQAKALENPNTITILFDENANTGYKKITMAMDAATLLYMNGNYSKDQMKANGNNAASQFGRMFVRVQ